MLTVTSTAIADAVKVVTPKLIADLRGAFCETYTRSALPSTALCRTSFKTINRLQRQSAPFVACIFNAIRTLKPN